ncbi:MAG: zinc-ribbon domain-containing protein [Lachnospiraceae bacterium]|nr:zinc-ribbon domain-containing protein [Lachnospiraceae bacterium]
MVCKKCGAPLMEDDQFCPECGAKVIRKKRCPECGEMLREGTRFCPSCGTEVGEGRPAKRADSEEIPKRRTDSDEVPRRRADSEEMPKRRTDSEEAPRRKPNPDAPRKKANPAPPPKKRPVQDERPRRRRDWEEEEWDDDDDEESVDILSIMTVAVGCILLVIVAVLGFNLYQRYVPKNYDKAAEEQEKEEEEGEDEGEEQEDGQRLEEPPEDTGEEEQVETAAAGTVVTVADVRIRDNPSTQGTTVITTAKKGESYEYAEVVEGGHWYKIYLPDEYGYEFGYVSADYVEPQ